jgi:hypothetical protein
MRTDLNFISIVSGHSRLLPRANSELTCEQGPDTGSGRTLVEWVLLPIHVLIAMATAQRWSQRFTLVKSDLLDELKDGRP